MAAKFRIALVGDYKADVIAHQAIPHALRLSGEALQHRVEGLWMHTASLTDPARQLEGFDGIWCIPASPYVNPEGALEAIRFARESARPFLGTCAGFQHALIEYARNVCGLQDAEHAEDNPLAEFKLITPLSCPLTEVMGEMMLDDGLIRKAYGEAHITEPFHCSYGLSRDHAAAVLSRDLRATAHDSEGEVRGVELAGHPFFVGTLFQPERRALKGEIPPLVGAFVAAVVQVPARA
jgi:CTP synthase (UTP-ammonia lyase)